MEPPTWQTFRRMGHEAKYNPTRTRIGSQKSSSRILGHSVNPFPEHQITSNLTDLRRSSQDIHVIDETESTETKGVTTGTKTTGTNTLLTSPNSNKQPKSWDWFRQLFVKEKKINEKLPPIIAPTYDELPPEVHELIKKSIYKKSDFSSSQEYQDLIAVLAFILRRSVRISSEPRLLPSDPTKRAEIRSILVKKFEQFERLTLNGTINDDPRKKYRILGEIGRGAFGRVFVGKDLKESTKVAIKKLPHLKDFEMKFNLREIGMQIVCKHPNVVDVLGTFLWKNEFWVVSEFCSLGNIRDLSMTRSLSEHQIAFILYEMTMGLEHIHSCGFIHRDIKPENAVINSDGHTKIIDFGLCVPVEHGEEGKIAGSPSFMSPELLKQQRYTQKADIWSLGVCVVEILNEQFPFSPQRQVRRVEKDRLSFLYSVAHSGKLPDIYEDDVWDINLLSFIRTCLTYDPDQRPDCSLLLNDPFLKYKKITLAEQFLESFKVHRPFSTKN